ncbi:MAG: hypothetical protein WCP14_02300 [bacterium]
MKIIKFNKISIIDWIFLAVTTALVVLLGISYIYKPDITGKPTLLTVRVTSDTASIEKTIAIQKQVYFNSTNNPVDYIGLKKEGTNLFITVRAPGKIEKDRLIFNGIRVLVGQKTELHSIYFAQGLITDVRYE